MAALTQNDLKGYIIGTNQFNFQDARVDTLQITVSDISDSVDKNCQDIDDIYATLGGGYGGESLVEDDTPLDWEGTSHIYSISLDENSLAFTKAEDGELEVELILSGDLSHNGATDAVEYHIIGVINPVSDGLGGTNFYELVPNEGSDSLEDCNLSSIKINNQFSQLSISFDNRQVSNFEASYVELGTFTTVPGKVSWSAIPIDEIYQEIVNRLIDEGYIQSQM